MKAQYIIQPGIGLGSIHFGIKPNDLIAILGNPTYINVDEFVPECGITVFKYVKQKLEFSFEKEYKNRLCSIEISGKNYTLQNRKLIGMKLPILLQEIENFGFEPPLIESISNENIENHLMLFYDTKSLMVQLIDNICVSINIYTLFKNNKVMWPKI